MKTELRKQIDDFCTERWPDESILLFGGQDGDPYDNGFIGVGYQHHLGLVAVYDRDRCVDALAEEFAAARASDDEDTDPYSDADEWFSFNTEGSWVGTQTPIVVSRFDRSGKDS
jgi:hypothetical protein